MPLTEWDPNNANQESPHYVRLSLAAAMTLGFTPGWFYRNAKLGCINLLLTYDGGCKANCAFCGLAGESKKLPSDRRFIRVPWRTFSTDEVIAGIKTAPEYVTRVCVSMITHPRCRDDVLTVCGRIKRETGKLVSLLISPTIMKEADLRAMKDAGADRIGVAVDAATPEIFHSLRGKPVGGPHSWDNYWKVYTQALEVFGRDMAGVHLICGLGEIEQEMATVIGRARSLGGCTHLFSFFPERGSAMYAVPAPAIGTYRRIQLARWLIDNDHVSIKDLRFDCTGKIEGFGLTRRELDEVIFSGSPFRTSGCPGSGREVACNRPYGNEKPGGEIRNFPFPPEASDLDRIAEELKN